MRIGFGLLGGVGVAAALALAAFAPAAQATSYQVIYTAPSGQTLHPAVGAVNNGVIYGSDPSAGASGAGILFTMSNAGKNYKVLHTFTGPDGQTPNARLVVVGGQVYGTTQWGGSATLGTVFKMSAQGALVWSFPFTGNLGFYSLDGLARAPSGFLYGTTSNGSVAPGNGMVFLIGGYGNPVVLHKFQSRNDGHCPYTGVAIDSQGNVFGTAVGLGFGGQPTGSIWEMPVGQKLTTLYSFKGGADGEYPEITPTLDGSDNLWGVSTNGGAANGAIWELTKAGFKVRYSFTSGADGYNPNSPLLLGKDGNLYGTTSGGGSASFTNGLGTVFKITPQGQFSTVHTFRGGADGGTPTGSLALAASGDIYGGTQAGTVFRIIP